MGDKSLNQILQEIENRFHREMDVEGAELVYLARSRIEKFKRSAHDMRLRLNELEKRFNIIEKSAPSEEGAGDSVDVG